MNPTSRASIFETDPLGVGGLTSRREFGRASIFEIDPVLSVGGLTSRREIVAAALTSRQGCAARHRDAATANLGGRRSSRSIPPSASEVSPRDVNLGRASILEIDPALSVGGLTSRCEIVAAALTSRQCCAARHRDAATANLVGRRSSRSIPHSASEVSPRDVNLGRASIFEILERRRSSRSIPFSTPEVSPRDVKSLPLL